MADPRRSGTPNESVLNSNVASEFVGADKIGDVSGHWHQCPPTSPILADPRRSGTPNESVLNSNVATEFARADKIGDGSGHKFVLTKFLNFRN